VASQQAAKLSFRLAQAIEAGHIEMADVQIHNQIQQVLAITGLGQPQEAGAAKPERCGAAAVWEGESLQHSGAGVAGRSARLQRAAGIARTHHPGRLVTGDDSTRTNHGAFPNRDARS
jgi:hypothetical protein